MFNNDIYRKRKNTNTNQTKNVHVLKASIFQQKTLKNRYVKISDYKWGRNIISTGFKRVRYDRFRRIQMPQHAEDGGMKAF